MFRVPRSVALGATRTLLPSRPVSAVSFLCIPRFAGASLGRGAAAAWLTQISPISVVSVRNFSGSPTKFAANDDKRGRRWRSARRRSVGKPDSRSQGEVRKAGDKKAAQNQANEENEDDDPLTARIYDTDGNIKEHREDPSDGKSGRKSGAGAGSNSNEGENENESGSKDQEDGAKKGANNTNSSPYMRLVELEINVTQILWGVFGLVFLMSFFASTDYVPEITYQEFKTQYLDRGQVDNLQVVNNSLVRVFTRGSPTKPVAVFTIGSVDSFERHLKEAQDNLHIVSKERVPVSYLDEGSFMSSVFTLLPTLMFLGFLVWIGRKAGTNSAGGGPGGAGGVFGIGKTKAHLYNPKTDVKVRFDDVAGMDEAKVEIMEFVNFLKEPKKYERLGAKIPRGAILSGAPGTGKTLLAKATAGEAGVPFFAVSGSEFVEMFSGVGASRVRDLFKKAKEQAPAMIWIDEIDAIGKARTGANVRGGNDEREATLNQLLVEMDGFGSNEHIVVLAGTNRADVLDKALLRPGRFDRHIQIDLPTLEGRKDIYKVHLANIKYDERIEELPGKLAAMTPGFSGADIANCCNEAALAAARENKTIINMSHFEKAIDRVIAGLERRSRVLPKDKRKIVAYHEAGHAVAGWFLRYADPLVKVTIVPHGSAALGYAQLLPSDNNITTENRMMDLMTVALGGRVSEEIFFDTVTVGASDDFKRITGIAKAMVMDYGMSQKLGAVYLDRQPGSIAKSFSASTDAVIDEEVKKIITTAHESCKSLLLSKKEQIVSVAEELLNKEVLTRQDLVRLLGPRPFQQNEHEAFKKYLDVN